MIQVKENKSDHEFQRKSNQLERQGYKVVSVVEKKTRPGVFVCLLFPFAVFMPKRRLVVTYQS